MRQPLGAYSETGWEVFPQGLTDLLLWFKHAYDHRPMYITENGAAFYDPPLVEKRPYLRPLRINCLHKHLRAIHDAITAGVDIRGCMAWSLLDNIVFQCQMQIVEPAIAAPLPAHVD